MKVELCRLLEEKRTAILRSVCILCFCIVFFVQQAIKEFIPICLHNLRKKSERKKRSMVRATSPKKQSIQDFSF